MYLDEEDHKVCVTIGLEYVNGKEDARKKGCAIKGIMLR